ncbi:MAG: Gfo/Idh/MocA family oxidoreductase [Candidatus Omnitrophica bacterium]|nr:Gfo/Idh/MocA family oxidoreductase [Candidatus Omnitrophota bacterium]
MIKIGVVNIDVSHPRSFASILHKENRARYSAIYNDGFRTDEEIEEFMREFNLEKRYGNVEELAKVVDIVFIQGCNWDRHLELAEPAIKLGKPVFIDKPIVGNLADCIKLENLVKKGAVILGSSSVRYAEEFVNAKRVIEENEEEIISVFGTAGVDEFNYGVHIMEGIQGFLGSGAYSVKFIGSTKINDNIIEQYFVRWKDGKTVIYQTQTPQWQPFDVIVTTTKNIHHFRVDSAKIYKAMLDKICDFMERGIPLAKITDLTETIRIYLAGKVSKENEGKEIKLTELKVDDSGYDGAIFEAEYAAKNDKEKL